MVLRRMSVRTRQCYSEAVAGLAKHYRRRPDELTEREIQAYLLHLIEERKLSFSSCKVALHGLRFFYHETLKHPEMQFDLPRARTPQRLPEILSREEIERLFAAANLLKHRVLLMTTYAAGLRVSEVCALRVSDIDSARMTIRVEQGKGAKDRYTLLSPRLLKELRLYWQAHRPQQWLFPAARRADRALNPHTAQKMFYAAEPRLASAAGFTG